MRFAYLFGLHHRPDQFRWLFRALEHEDDLFVLHVDRQTPPSTRAALVAVAGTRPNVFVLPARRVVWGGWGMAQIQFDAFRFLGRLDRPWDYFIHLSGQDYPLTSRAERVRRLAADPTRNYVYLKPLAEAPLHLALRYRVPWVEVGRRVVPLPVPRALPRAFRHAWKGSNWNVLSRAFCDWAATASLAEACEAYYRRVCLPEEFALPNLIMNGPFRDTVVPTNLREINWRPGAWHPAVFTWADRERLLRSPALFARKFDAAVDPDVLRLLAAHVGAEPA